MLKSGADAAGIAATIEMGRQLSRQPDILDADLKAKLESVVRRYVLLNFAHLPPGRLARATDTLVVDVTPHRSDGTVDVSAQADLGGTLFSRNLQFLGNYPGPEAIGVVSKVERVTHPVEVVLAIDISGSMERCLDQRRGNRCHTGDSRIDVVKRAAMSLVGILAPNEFNKIAVGVVPWHMVVSLDERTRRQWVASRWAEYPAGRLYGAPYNCRSASPCQVGDDDQDVAPTPPETWQGCLDEHRMTGSRAALPGTGSPLAPPSISPFAQAFFPAPYGTAYECLDADTVPPDYYQQFATTRTRPRRFGFNE